jgi:tetratricopeptide (TPR) repeat protein
MAQLSIAQSWEAERDFVRAIDAYQGLLKELGPRDFLYEEVLIDLGRVQEWAGRKSDAIETYRRVLRDVTASRRAEDVRIRLGSLGVSARP